jgi:hypothetical protein
MWFVGEGGVFSVATRYVVGIAIVDRRIRSVLIGFSLFLGLGGCGYSLEGMRTSLPQEVRTIAIPTMTNRTVEPGIENIFTRAAIREFNLDGRLKVVPKARADSLLEGSIQDFYISSISYDAAGLVLAYRARVTLGVILRRIDTGEILWEAPSIQETQEYRVASSVQTNEARKRLAIVQIAEVVAETVRDLIMDRF